ncbi:MAG: ribonuclease R [Deltaproteobacteria bacterium]|nr:ribonuclease R [Deltaproteobacteria bacterium]
MKNINENSIIDFLSQENVKPKSFHQIAAHFKLSKKFHRELKRILKKLLLDGKIQLSFEKRYKITEEEDYVTGSISKNPKGFAFLIPDDRNLEDIYITPRDLKDAMNDDRVSILVMSTKKQRGKSLSGTVVKILERSISHASGVLSSKNGKLCVKTQLNETFSVQSNAKNIPLGDLVKIHITKYPSAYTTGQASLILHLGTVGNPQAETKAIIANHKLYSEFSSKTLYELQSIGTEIKMEELQGRKDLRDIPLVTIDGEDARDFDDAVCVQETQDGFKLFVAIADVAHYVTQKTSLDHEAYLRGCSTYFPDEVLPMLPQKLSNDLCSLVPNKPRLTMTCEMDFDRNADLRDYTIYDSVIHSRARLTYTFVQEVFDQKAKIPEPFHQDVIPNILSMKKLYEKLKEKRRNRGSLDFDLPEPLILVDAQGRTTDIRERQRFDAHMLIEEFMIAANECVATHLFEKKMPTLYRSHEPPDSDKMMQLSVLLHNLGYDISIDIKSPQDLSKILGAVSGKPEENLINIVLLRSMKQARYSASIHSHFALASPFYTHFTSPIRRYPDLIVHRSLKKLNKTGRSTDTDLDSFLQSLEKSAMYLSERERISEEAEREVVKYKQTLFMQDKIGKVFRGHISGIVEFGLFVQLDQYFVEGLIHVENLGDDFYQFIEEQFVMRGMKRKKEFKLGDTLNVRVIRANPFEQEIDFEIAQGQS